MYTIGVEIIEDILTCWVGMFEAATVILFSACLFMQFRNWGFDLLKPLTRLFRRSWVEVGLLLFFVGGMVQYGATKGFLGGSSMMCSPMTSVQLPTVTEGAGPQFPAFTARDDGGAPQRIANGWCDCRVEMGDVDAWMKANADNRAWHACAIVKGQRYLYFKHRRWGRHSVMSANKGDW